MKHLTYKNSKNDQEFSKEVTKLTDMQMVQIGRRIAIAFLLEQPGIAYAKGKRCGESLWQLIAKQPTVCQDKKTKELLKDFFEDDNWHLLYNFSSSSGESSLMATSSEESCQNDLETQIDSEMGEENKPATLYTSTTIHDAFECLNLDAVEIFIHKNSIDRVPFDSSGNLPFDLSFKDFTQEQARRDSTLPYFERCIQHSENEIRGCKLCQMTAKIYYKDSKRAKFISKVIDWYLAAGVNIDRQNAKGNTLMMIACKHRFTDSYGHLIASKLYKFGASLRINNNMGMTPLMIVCKYGNADFIKDLRKTLYKSNSKIPARSVENDRQFCLNNLLVQKNVYSLNSIVIACLNNRPEILRNLAKCCIRLDNVHFGKSEHKSLPKEERRKMWTREMLAYSCIGNSKDCVEFLLDYGVSTAELSDITHIRSWKGLPELSMTYLFKDEIFKNKLDIIDRLPIKGGPFLDDFVYPQNPKFGTWVFQVRDPGN